MGTVTNLRVPADLNKFMKKFILLVPFLFLALSISTHSSFAEPTEKQKEFAEKLLENSAVLKTRWGDNLTLFVYVDLNALGHNPKLQAQLAADDIANQGVKFTGKDICATIYYGNGHELANSCRNVVK